MKGTYLTDGMKAIPLQDLRADAWTPVDPIDAATQGQVGAARLAGLVPVLFRCIDIRANAVAGVPFRLEKNGKDVSTDPTYDALREKLRTMLWFAEAGLCFKAAYWELATNRMGKNITPFWLSPWTITPQIDPREGLQYFQRSAGTFAPIPKEKMLYIWNPDPSVEEGEGRAPAAVVLAAAGLLRDLDRYAAAFFQRGAIKMTLLSVPPSTPPDERTKLKHWWDGIVQGVTSSFRSIVISTEVKPTVIGSDPKESSAPELVKLAREDVMVGMGVPQSLVFSNPLAGGTVDAERLNFYDFTVLPQCNTIYRPMNEQYLSKLGLRLIGEPEKLEVYQASELRKAQGLMAIVGEPFYLADEARSQMGKEPREIAEQKLKLQIAEQRKAEGLPEPPPPVEEAAPMGEAIPDPTTMPPAELPVDEEVKSQSERVIPLRVLDLQRWEAKALKKPGKVVLFTPDALSDEDTAWVRAGLDGATVGEIKSLFDSLKKAPDEDLTERERVLYEKVKRVLSKYGDEVAAQIVSNGTPDLSGLDQPLRAALLADLTAVALEVMGGLADTIGPDFDPATMGGKAAEWARGYTYELVKGLTETSRKTVQQATEAFFRDGLSSKDVAALLSPAFGERRAASIAITELTRASSAATTMYQAQLKEAGLNYEVQWLTANDERTCAICTPRNGTIQGSGWDELPPGHVRCRCRTALVRAK